MAVNAYRMVGPSPQAAHFVCDLEVEMPAVGVQAGDTAYAKDTARLFRRGNAAWIESVPVGHVHVVGDVGGLQAGLEARELVANRGVAGGYASLDGAGRLPVGQLCAHDHAQADVANLATDLAGKAPTSHGHGQAEITGLVVDLAGKAAGAHGHGQADVTNLVADLGSKASSVHAHAQADVTGLVAALGARPAFQVLHKTADQSRDLTALTDCTGLSFQADALASYGFIMTTIFQTAATSVGPRFSMNGPAGGQLTSWRSEIEVTGGPSTSAVNIRSVSVPDTEHVVASVDQANTSRVARLQGAWRNGANAGPVTVRFGAEVAGTNITVKQGSWGLVFPLP